MDSFDVVVIGSGFGGAVTAYRLASAGHSVCVLERGRAYPPGSFARSPYTVHRAFWDPDSGYTGLFDVWSFRHMNGVVAAGLGGGSLIYANVLIRKDENWFADTGSSSGGAWPISRRTLDPHYDNVEQVLSPQVFPMRSEPYTEVRKTAEFMQAAAAEGFMPTDHNRVDVRLRQWYLPLLGITFANDGRPPAPGEAIRENVRNLHDRDRQTCRLVGECDLGCNYGSKNSLDYNYLTLASVRHGADLRTLANAKTIELDNAGITVTYRQYEAAEAETNGRTPFHDRRVRGRHVVLAAGTFGTNLLLRRNYDNLRGLSPRLGQGFSGNGDLLTMVLRASRTVDGKKQNRILDPSYGPVITSTLRSPDGLDDGSSRRGFYLQDAG